MIMSLLKFYQLFFFSSSFQGKESVEMILEKLEAKGCGITENYETFSRVSIRRLGRLLPDARWVGCQACAILYDEG